MNQGVKVGLRELGYALLRATVLVWRATVWCCARTWRIFYWSMRKFVWMFALCFGPIVFILGWNARWSPQRQPQC